MISRDHILTIALSAFLSALVALTCAFIVISSSRQAAKELEVAIEQASLVTGSNAVTVDSLLSNTECAVTLEDLERGYELGQAYPLNGKGAALDANTTYGRGAGMVDLVTLDECTNVQIRHYGQLNADGTVSWYAAETVLDAEGKPVVTPRE